MKKISTSQQLDKRYYTAGHSQCFVHFALLLHRGSTRHPEYSFSIHKGEKIMIKVKNILNICSKCGCYIIIIKGLIAFKKLLQLTRVVLTDTLRYQHKSISNTWLIMLLYTSFSNI